MEILLTLQETLKPHFFHKDYRELPPALAVFFLFNYSIVLHLLDLQSLILLFISLTWNNFTQWRANYEAHTMCKAPCWI